MMAMALVLVFSAFSTMGLVLAPSSASAATVPVNATIDQCNGVGATPADKTTTLTCTVEVVNTINGASRSSTTTVTRLCAPGPCPGGNGALTSESTSLVTNVSQCNGSANGAALQRITCRVRLTSNISSDTPGADSVMAATVNQCVGSGGSGTDSVVGRLVCAPFPSITTGATVSQCNGSANGGGSIAVCSLAPYSEESPAIPVKVNQCNGVGNRAGAVVTCMTSITNYVRVVASTPPPCALVPVTPSPVVPSPMVPVPVAPVAPDLVAPIPGAVSPGAVSRGAVSRGAVSRGAANLVSRIPTDGVSAGGGSTAGLDHVGLLVLGGGLLFGAAMATLFGWRSTRTE